MIAPWLLVVVFSLVLLAAAAGTWLLRHYALTHSVLDIPNDRSSHTTPTPRGGGVAIVLAFIAGILTFTVVGAVRSDVAIALLGAGTIVAIVGFIDDHEHIPARWRLLAHFSAAIWALVWLHGLPPIAVMGGTVNSGWLGDVLAIIALVWLLNLYNFMDGIDGIAGIETVTVCLAAVLVYAASGAPTSESLLPATLGAATAGFLVWNFPPAKIFMGDAGSGFLGLMLGVMAVRSATISSDYLWSWIILLGVFATRTWNPAGADGLLAGNASFFFVEVGAVVFASIWSIVFTYGMLWLIDKVTPVRVTAETEEGGLDQGLHGEIAYEGV